MDSVWDDYPRNQFDRTDVCSRLIRATICVSIAGHLASSQGRLRPNNVRTMAVGVVHGIPRSSMIVCISVASMILGIKYFDTHGVGRSYTQDSHMP